MRTVGRIVVAIVLGILVLMVTGAASTVALKLSHQPVSGSWTVGIVTEAAMLLASLLLILMVSRGRLPSYGFTWASISSLSRSALAGLAIGVLSGVAQSLIVPGENPIAADFSFLQIVVIIWLCASTAEEILTRGLVQGFLTPLAQRGFTVFRCRVSLPVLVGALFFGAMHLALLSQGASQSSVFSIVVSGSILGLVAGYAREKSGSLIPAILVHMFANIGGTIIEHLVT